MKSSWRYDLDGGTIAEISRDDIPVVGDPVNYVGRLGKPAPVEHFAFTKVDEVNRIVTLVRREV